MSWSFWLECPLRFVSLVFVTLNMKIGAAFVALPVFRFSAFPFAVCRLHLHLAQISTRGKANYWIFIFPISPLTAYVEIFLLHFCFAPPHCHFPFAICLSHIAAIMTNLWVRFSHTHECLMVCVQISGHSCNWLLTDGPNHFLSLLNATDVRHLSILAISLNGLVLKIPKYFYSIIFR